MPSWFCTKCKTKSALQNNVCRACDSEAPEWVKIYNEQQTIVASAERSNREIHRIPEADNEDVVEIDKNFECAICRRNTPPRQGIRLRNCLDEICKECLTRAVENEQSGIIRCGFCNFEIEDRDVFNVVSPELWERRQERVTRHVTANLENVQRCRRPGCDLIAEVIGGENFTCPSCHEVTCLRCDAFHPGRSCQQYQEENQEGDQEGDQEQNQEANEEWNQEWNRRQFPNGNQPRATNPINPTTILTIVGVVILVVAAIFFRRKPF